MLRHADVWRALDLLAERHGLSPSGLARRAGLDPSTFNRSKRTSAAGKPHWPSTESLEKALAAVEAAPADFVRLLAEREAAVLTPRLPLIPASRAASSDVAASNGLPDLSDASSPPLAESLREFAFPGLEDADAFVLEIDSDAYRPLYRPGDLLIVSPPAHLSVGHRVAVGRRLSARPLGILHLDVLEAQDPGALVLERQGRLPSQEVAWMSRILWASQ